MTEIGMSTSCYYPLETEKSLENVCKTGIKKAEIFINAYTELDEPFVSVYKKLLNDYSVNLVSLHTTASFADGYNYFSDYYRRFEESLDVFRKQACLANELGAKFVVMHGLKKIAKASDELYLERFKILTQLAKQSGVSLLQENVVNFRSESPDFIQKMKDYIGEDFAITLDIKQCRRAGYSPNEFIERFHDIIKHVHISDADGEKDCITPLKGDFDFQRFFTVMNGYGYEGDYIIELYKNSYSDEAEILNSYNALSEILKRVE